MHKGAPAGHTAGQRRAAGGIPWARVNHGKHKNGWYARWDRGGGEERNTYTGWGGVESPWHPHGGVAASRCEGHMHAHTSVSITHGATPRDPYPQASPCFGRGGVPYGRGLQQASCSHRAVVNGQLVLRLVVALRPCYLV